MEKRNETRELQSARRGRKRNGRKSLLSLALLFASVVVILGLWYRQFGSSRIHISENSLFGVQGGEVAVLYNYELQSDKAALENSSVYLPPILVKREMNRRFYWDKDEKCLVYAASGGVRTFTAEEVDTEGKSLFFVEDQTLYLLLSLSREFTNVRTEAYMDGEVKRLLVETAPESDEVRATKHKTVLRSWSSVCGGIVTVATKVEAFCVIPDYADVKTDTACWVRIKTDSGFTRYVQQRSLQAAETVPYQNSLAAQDYGTLPIGGKVLLGFHFASDQAANQGPSMPAGNVSGMNVIVLTWFSFRGNEGDYQSYAGHAYVEAAHEKGLKVFALLDNFDKSVTMGELLKKTFARKRLVDSLMTDANLYDFDGINVDLELIKQEAIDQYLEFIHELSAACHAKQLYLTVDVPNPMKFNAYYDRKELAVFCDYVINMGYDGHTGGDASDSMTSLGFMTMGLDTRLEEIPKEKPIQAVPFCTWSWTEDKNGKVSSEVLDMKAVQDWVNKNQVSLTYDETLGQNYGRRSANGSIQSIWMEDAKLMQACMEVIWAKDLAGTAV